MQLSGKDELKKMLILTEEKLKRYKRYKRHKSFEQKYIKLQKLYIILLNALNDKLLKPTEMIHNSEKIFNRRKYYRINLMFPLSSQMSLTTTKGQKVKLDKTEVLIQDIGFGGLKFLSTLDLPVFSDLVLQFETKIMDQEVNLIGIIVWKKEEKELCQYGFQFIIDEKESDDLVRLLNNFSIRLRKNPLPKCSFIQEDEITYLKKSLNAN